MSAQYERPPRRAELSQHFLRSGALAGSLVAQARVTSRDLVVEIGPGRGALTTELSRRCRRLIAVELDPRLCRLLRDRFGSRSHVDIVHGDFMRFGLPHDPYKVVGSLPFARTSAILRRLVDSSRPPTEVYVVVQREAAHRFAGAPHARESLQSLLLKPEWQVEILRHLRPADFDPQPGVDAAVLWLARRIGPLVDTTELEGYRRFVRSCFGQGGHTIRQCLRSTFTRTEIGRLGDDLRFRLEARPSGLTFDQWLGLFRFHTLR